MILGQSTAKHPTTIPSTNTVFRGPKASSFAILSSCFRIVFVTHVHSRSHSTGTSSFVIKIKIFRPRIAHPCPCPWKRIDSCQIDAPPALSRRNFYGSDPTVRIFLRERPNFLPFTEESRWIELARSDTAVFYTQTAMPTSCLPSHRLGVFWRWTRAVLQFKYWQSELAFGGRACGARWADLGTIWSGAEAASANNPSPPRRGLHAPRWILISYIVDSLCTYLPVAATGDQPAWTERVKRHTTMVTRFIEQYFYDLQDETWEARGISYALRDDKSGQNATVPILSNHLHRYLLHSVYLAENIVLHLMQLIKVVGNLLGTNRSAVND